MGKKRYNKNIVNSITIKYIETLDDYIFSVLLFELEGMIDVQLGKNYVSARVFWDDLKQNTLFRLWKNRKKVIKSVLKNKSLYYYGSIRGYLNAEIIKLRKIYDLDKKCELRRHEKTTGKLKKTLDRDGFDDATFFHRQVKFNHKNKERFVRERALGRKDAIYKDKLNDMECHSNVQIIKFDKNNKVKSGKIVSSDDEFIEEYSVIEIRYLEDLSNEEKLNLGIEINEDE